MRVNLPRFSLLFATLTAAFALPAASEEGWRVAEVVRPYPIEGATAPALYQSIGARGPTVGTVRVIAHTTFKLTWTRRYENRDGACLLDSARPKLTITYTLPKPSAKLDPALQNRWDAFYAGLKRHEAVHGASMVEMTRETERETVGLRVVDDADCRKARAEVARRALAASVRQRERSVAFDRVEMGRGGTVEMLVLGLLNG